MPPECDFALLGHPSSYEHLVELFLRSRPDYDRSKLRNHKATIVKLFEWTPSYATPDPVVVMLRGSRRLTGRLVVCTFLPEELTSARQLALSSEKTRQGHELLRRLGARSIGLGGFTSIVSGTDGLQPSDEDGRCCTTSGNALTAALALAQLDALLERLGWRLANRTVALLGATGDIGRACARVLAPRARRLLLVARNPSKLVALRDELAPRTEVSVTTDARDARRASIIIAATSAGQPLLTEADLRPGSVVCDIGYPKTIATREEPRPDALVFSGGLAELPEPLDIGYYTRLPEHLIYGCFAEAIVLAAAAAADRAAFSGGGVTLEKMERALSLAETMGFSVAPAYRGKQRVDDEQLDRFMSTASRGKSGVR